MHRPRPGLDCKVGVWTWKLFFWVNDSIAYAGGERLLIKTSNAGQTWEELTYQFDGRVVDLVFKNSNLGLAVGNSGLILKTVDGGNSWSKINIGQSSDFHDISYNGENNWIISGSSGKIFESTNDGTSWQENSTGQTKLFLEWSLLIETLFMLLDRRV